MPTLAKRQAIEKLVEAVRGLSPDYLLDFYNELFPQRHLSESDFRDAGAAARQTVMDCLSRGVEIEELLDLWNVAFPGHCDVSYDEETGEIHYRVDREPIRQAD